MRRPSAIAPFTVLVAASGCSDDHFFGTQSAPASVECAQDIQSLEILPPASEIDVGEQRGAGLRMTAIAALSDGRRWVVPASWAASDTSIGSMADDGTFTPTAERGGSLTVTASAGGHVATARVNAKLAREILDDVPASVVDLFAVENDRDQLGPSPRFTSPAPGQTFAANESIRLEWSNAGLRYSRVVLQNTALELTLYTSETIYDLDAETVATLARSSAGSPIDLHLESVAADGGLVHVFREVRRIRLCSESELCNGADDDCNDVADESCTSSAQSFTASLGECP